MRPSHAFLFICCFIKFWKNQHFLLICILHSCTWLFNWNWFKVSEMLKLENSIPFKKVCSWCHLLSQHFVHINRVKLNLTISRLNNTLIRVHSSTRELNGCTLIDSLDNQWWDTLKNLIKVSKLCFHKSS